jgi:hypothetical protein
VETLETRRLLTNHLALTTPPPAYIIAGGGFEMAVAAEDGQGHVDSSYSGPITLSLAGSSNGANLGGKLTLGAVNGVALFDNLTFDRASTGVTIQATSGDLPSVTSNDLTVLPAAVHSFAVQYASDTTAGAPQALTIKALDSDGNVVTTYAGTVHLTSTDSLAVLPADYTFTPGDGGVHTFQVALDVQGKATISASDVVLAGVTGQSQVVTVQPGPVAGFDLFTFDPAVAGSAMTMYVSAADAYGNVVPLYTGTVHVTSDDTRAVLPADYSFTPGDLSQHTFTLTFKTAGTEAWRVRDTAHPTITSVEVLHVSPAPATVLSLTGPATTTAGAAAPLHLTAYDPYGNVATGYTGSVHFTSTDPHAVLPADYTFAASDMGSHTFTVALETVGSRAIAATDTAAPALRGQVSNIQVTPGAVSGFRVIYPATVAAGESHYLGLTATDAYGNAVTGYQGTVHFSSSDSKAALPADYTFTPADRGTHTFSAILKTAGQESLTATDTGQPSVTGQAAEIRVSPYDMRGFVLTFPKSVTAGASQTLMVIPVDRYGNVLTSYTGTIHFTSDDSHASLPADYTFSTTDGGSQVFQVALDTAGLHAIRATDSAHPSLTGLTSGTAVDPAGATTFRLTFPATTIAGVGATLTVTARDAYGNIATGYSGTVRFTSSDPNAVLPADANFAAGDQGVRNFVVTLKTAGKQSLAATDTAQTSLAGSNGGIQVLPGDMRGFVVTFPNAVTAGNAGAMLVIPSDAFGNILTSYTGTIHFTSDDTHAHLPADYTFTGADGGSHFFLATLESAGVRAVRATDTVHPSWTGLASGIVVSPAAAARVVVSGYPTSTTIGTPNHAVTTLYDAYGNVTTGYTGTLHFSSDDPLAILPSDWTFTAADAGTRTFTLTFGTAGTHYLKATDTGNPNLSGQEVGIIVA